MSEQQRYKTLLSLDGGGIRGLISARILQEIEARTNQPIHDLFDLIVGTSTGGIMATGLARPNSESGGPLSAKELVDLYRERGSKIFRRSWWDRVYDFVVGDEKYDAEPLERILNRMLGDTELRNTEPDIVVTSYDIESREPYMFKTSKAREAEDCNHLLRVVARATSAAPTFFEPLFLEKGEARALIDGGVFASNPSIIAVSEAVSSGADLGEILLCSIGVGTNNQKIPYEEAKDWGELGWAEPVISAMLDGMSDAADRNAQMLLSKTTNQQYFRFDIPLKKASTDPDDASKDNIVRLWERAHEIIERQSGELNQLVKLLLSRASIATNKG